MKTFGQFIQHMNEQEVPINNVGGGQIAGVGIGPDGTPPVRKKSKVIKRGERKDACH